MILYRSRSAHVSFMLFCWLSFFCLQGAWAQESTSRTSDLAIFRTQFFEADKSYSNDARAAAERLLQALEREPDALSDAQFQLEIAKIAALANNAHTALFNPRWTQTFNRIDIQFFIGADELYIGGARGELASLVGKRVEQVEGHTLDDLREVWSQYQSGRQGWRDVFLPYFIESPEMLHAAGVAESPDRITLTFEDGATKRIEAGTELVSLTGISGSLPPPRAISLAHMGFAPTTPLYLQEPDAIVRSVDLPEHNALYIQFRANADFTGTINVRERSDEIIGKLRTDAPQYVILDQRFNLGGDLNTTRMLMRTLPEVVGSEGHVYILISGRTFSAGISSVGYAKQAGKDRTTIIGSPPGDVLEFWAEGDFVLLPNAQTGVLLATERHNYMTGCPESDCHRSIRLHPIRVKTLDPDLPVAMRYEDFAAGKDPLLETALQLIRERE